MADEIVERLKEIADLFREQLARGAEMSKRSEERMAAIPTAMPSMPDFAAMEAQQAAAEAERKLLSTQRHAEEVEFRHQLLARLDRQNELLARVVAHITR